VGDGTIGYKEKSPYTKIIAWASMPTVPCALYEQLSEEGILLTPIGGDRVQHLYRVRKSNKPLIERLDSVIFMKATGLFGFYE
jgi:protein-L-isoaspartate(D-aspartate) O-methyltransferase